MGPFDTLTRISLEEATEFLLHAFPGVQDTNLVIQIGSGQVPTALLDEEWQRVSLWQMPHMPKEQSLAQHSLELIWGRTGDLKVLILGGRYHVYEGYGRTCVILPVWAAACAGVRNFLFTNASGAIRDGIAPGDFVLIRDHINNLGVPALAGQHHLLNSPYVDMCQTYTPELRASFARAAAQQGISCQEGVYLANLGPQFETPAEIQAAKAMGADIVGMSTVLEATVAHALGARVMGISMVVNPAAGLGAGSISHENTTRVGQKASSQLMRSIRHWLLDEAASVLLPPRPRFRES